MALDMFTAMQVFAEVVRRESFSAAAEQLSLSRSSVSKHVAFLETHFSARLLQRTTRRLYLTEAGRDTLARIETILEAVAQLEESRRHGQQIPRGRLRISAPHAFGTRYLGPVLADHQRRYPEVSLEIELSDRRVDLVEEGFDAALRVGTLDDSALIARSLGTVAIRLCAAPEYIAAHGAPEHPDDLARHRCLGYSYARHGSDWLFEGPTGPVRARPALTLKANGGDLLVNIALAGGGIVMQPDFMVDPALADGRLVALLPDYPIAPIRVHIVYPQRRLMPARLRTFLAHLDEAFSAPA